VSFIDWSDPDEMLGLLVEYVADEALACDGDAERAEFLRMLRGDLEDLARREHALNEIAEALRQTRSGQPREFLGDPVIEHLDACIEELHRIGILSRNT
jgi:hypothetical protein